MGRDKALLPWNGATLAQHVARAVADAAGSVALVGDPARYGFLGYVIHPDCWPGCGPLGGIATALAVSEHEWSVVTGCDMPGISPDSLRYLLREAEGSSSRCILPIGPEGPEPLCGVYHRDCLPLLEKAIAEGRLRMKDAVSRLSARLIGGLDTLCFANLNTPEDFEAFAHK